MDILMLLIFILIIGILIIGYFKLKQYDNRLEVIENYTQKIDDLSLKINKLQSKYFISKISNEQFDEKNFDSLSNNSLLNNKSQEEVIDPPEIHKIILDENGELKQKDNITNEQQDNNLNQSIKNDNDITINEQPDNNDIIINEQSENNNEIKEQLETKELPEISITKVVEPIISDAMLNNNIFSQDTHENNDIQDFIQSNNDDINLNTFDSLKDSDINFSGITASQINNDIIELDNKDNKYDELIDYLNKNDEKTCKLKEMKIIIVNCGIDKINKDYYFLKKNDMYKKLKAINFIN